MHFLFLLPYLLTSELEKECSIIATMFPKIKVHFIHSAEWHKNKYGIQSHFGLYWNLCINAAFPQPVNAVGPQSGSHSVHCIPHTDHKNGISVCILLIYVKNLDISILYSNCITSYIFYSRQI